MVMPPTSALVRNYDRFQQLLAEGLPGVVDANCHRHRQNRSRAQQ
jgi:hypothetical protein